MGAARKRRTPRPQPPRLRTNPGATRSLIRGRATASSHAISAETLTPQPSPVVRQVPGGPRGPHPQVPTSYAQRVRAWLSRQARYSPARLALSTFALIIGVITVLLMLPIASASDEPAPFVDVLFTAVSAVCVTGLTTVDTASYWSPFGQAVIAAGIVVGGLGVMTLASILAFAVSRHLGLTQRMLATQETGTGAMGQISTLLKAVIATSLSMQAFLAIMFLPRFLTMGIDPVYAVWDAVFMAISVFNNAGFVILPGGLEPHVTDWWMLVPIILGTTVGAIGFPVIMDVAKNMWLRAAGAYIRADAVDLSDPGVHRRSRPGADGVAQSGDAGVRGHSLEDPQCNARGRQFAVLGYFGAQRGFDAFADALCAGHPHDDRRRLRVHGGRREGDDVRGAGSGRHRRGTR